MMDKNESKFQWYVTTIIAIVALIIAYFTFSSDNKRDLRITDYRLSNVRNINWTEEYEANPYTEAFIHCFSDAYVQFNLENHSKFDIEYYGFYFQIQFPNFAHQRINIPINAAASDGAFEIDVFYSDWDAVARIDKQIIPSNTTTEFTASLEKRCDNLSILWFWNSGLDQTDHQISKVLEKAYLKNKLPNVKCRIACKDTFGDYHYSNWITVNFD